MKRAGLSRLGRFATWMAWCVAPPYKAAYVLGKYNSQGYISPTARIYHANIKLGEKLLIGDRVCIFQNGEEGHVELGDRVQLYGDMYLETADGGSIVIDDETHIQPRCHFVAGKASIRIGKRAEIAAGCAFYPFNHGMAPGEPVRTQPLESRGDIVIEDDVWLGYGVIVLDGVRIGEGAVVGAGAVVTRDIPANAIAVGAPAKVMRMRDET
jgi:acetyltransferase-like isoleucine patch superfamily enzyme